MDPSNDDRQARVIAFLRRRGAIVLLLLLAGAAVVYLTRDDGSHPALPDYTLAEAGAVPGSLELRAGVDAPFELVLRPKTPVQAKVVAYVFAIGEGEPNAVDAKIDLAAGGEVHISGRPRALVGAREVRVVLGAAEDFKRYEDALSRARDGQGDAHVRVLAVPIVRVASALP